MSESPSARRPPQGTSIMDNVIYVNSSRGVRRIMTATNPLDATFRTPRCPLLYVQVSRRLTTPCLGDQRLELSGCHCGQANQNSREPVVVGLGAGLPLL